MSQDHVDVTINGMNFKVVNQSNVDRVHRVARHVDEKMDELRDAGVTSNSLRLAILAALNIADEYFDAKTMLERVETIHKNTIEQLNRYHDKVDRLLNRRDRPM